MYKRVSRQEDGGGGGGMEEGGQLEAGYTFH